MQIPKQIQIHGFVVPATRSLIDHLTTDTRDDERRAFLSRLHYFLLPLLDKALNDNKFRVQARRLLRDGKILVPRGVDIEGLTKTAAG